MEDLPSLAGRRVLDIGTGTGILSVAALHLGASLALGLDLDPEAASTCARNARLNRDRGHMPGTLLVLCGTLEALRPSARFHLVLANIYGDIILRQAARMAAHVGEGGHLLLSGIDFSENDAVRKALVSQGMERVAVIRLEDYITQLWRRPQPPAPVGP